MNKIFTAFLILLFAAINIGLNGYNFDAYFQPIELGILLISWGLSSYIFTTSSNATQKENDTVLHTKTFSVVLLTGGILFLINFVGMFGFLTKPEMLGHSVMATLVSLIYTLIICLYLIITNRGQHTKTVISHPAVYVIFALNSATLVVMYVFFIALTH